MRTPSDRPSGEGWLHALDAIRPLPAVLPAPSAERADPATCSRVYTDLLRLLALDAAHAAQLLARGLTADDITRAGYRTLPPPDRRPPAVAALAQLHGTETLLRVPGFRCAEGAVTLGGPSGIIIPARLEDGSIPAIVVRPDAPRGPKYLWLSSAASGGPGAPATTHIPLRPSDAPPSRVLVITEGTLKADVAAALLPPDQTCIGIPGVAAWKQALGMVARIEERQERAFDRITVALDEDAPPNPAVERARAELAAALVRWYKPERVTVTRWDGGRAKGIDDALMAGLDLVESPVDLVETTSSNLMKAPTSAADATEEPWEPPIPLDAPPVPAWPSDIIPGWVGEYVAAVADAIQVAPDIVGAVALAVVSACVQNRACISLGTWEEPLSLYLSPVAPPSERKSAAVSRVITPLSTWQREEAERIDPDRRAALARVKVFEGRAERARKEAERADTIDLPDAMRAVRDAEEELAEAVLAVPRAPVLLHSGDVTMERLAGLMSEHGERLAVISGEPVLFEMMRRYSKTGAANQSVLLSAYTGEGIRIDRQPPALPITMRHPLLTLCVCQQPSALPDVLGSETRGRGLPARFLWCIPQPLAGRRTVPPPTVPEHLSHRWETAIHTLLRDVYADQTEEAVLRFDADAERLWLDWHRRTEARQREDGDLSFAPDWAGKLVGNVGRVAGILHLMRHGLLPSCLWKPVTEDTVAAAIRFGEYAVGHARAVYGMAGLDDGTRDAARHILRLLPELAPSFSKRDLHRRMHSRASTLALLVGDSASAALDAPLRLLTEHGYLTPAERAQGKGRPSERYRVNPFLTSREFGDNGDKSPCLGPQRPHSVTIVTDFLERDSENLTEEDVTL